MKYFKVFLSLVIITTGCASTTRRVTPAKIELTETLIVEQPKENKISQEAFIVKVSELKGKIRILNSRQSNSQILSINDQLDSLVVSEDLARDRSINKGLGWGLVAGILPAPFIYVKENGTEFGSLISVVSISSLIWLGTTTGWLIGQHKCKYIQKRTYQKLIDIINEHNSLVGWQNKP
jgi:VIT1/CCC1 family predicted Fe2+/Mn2+ transporter